MSREEQGRLRLRVEQFAPALGDRAANLRRIAAAQREAADDGVQLLVTPELSLTGYDLRDRVHELAAPLDPLVPELEAGPDLIVGTVERGENGIPFNAAVHLRGGRVLHRHRKVYLPTYGMFDEGRFFGRGTQVRGYDAGGGWRIGLLVCEDLWHPALVYLLATGGVNLLIVQAAAAGRGIWEGAEGGRKFASWSTWETLACAAAAAYGIYVVVANRVGVEGPCVFAGGSLIVGPEGRTRVRGSDEAEDRPTAELELSAVATARRPFSHVRDEDPHLVARELDRLLRESP